MFIFAPCRIGSDDSSFADRMVRGGHCLGSVHLNLIFPRLLAGGLPVGGRPMVFHVIGVTVSVDATARLEVVKLQSFRLRL